MPAICKSLPTSAERALSGRILVAESGSSATRLAMPPLVRMAAMAGLEQPILKFLAAGGQVECADQDGRSLLWLAASRGHSTICSTLIRRGANILARDSKGLSVAEAASRSGSNPTIAVVKVALDQPLIAAGKPGPAILLQKPNPPEHSPSASFVTEPSRADSIKGHPMFQGEAGILRPALRPAILIDSLDWDAEEDLPDPEMDEELISGITSVQDRISAHEIIDQDPEWSQIAFDLPNREELLHRASLYKGFSRQFLRTLAGMIEEGNQSGMVPEIWVSRAIRLLTDGKTAKGRSLDLLCSRRELGLEAEDGVHVLARRILVGLFASQGIQIERIWHWLFERVPDGDPDSLDEDLLQQLRNQWGLDK